MLVVLASSLSVYAAPRAQVAAHEIPAGAVLAGEDIASVKLRIVLPADALTAPEQAIGATTLRPIDAGAVIRSAWLVGGPLSAAPRAGSVVALSDLPVRVSPAGTARITELSRGESAYVGLLSLDPGAAIPAHRDATEEYIHVIEGYGTLTMNGQDHDLGPGSTVYMPAQAEVSFVNSERPMRAFQVFAGPAPASKYDSWSLAAPVAASASVGPFQVSCADTQCAVSYQGRPVAKDLSFRPSQPPGAPAPLPHEGLLSGLALFPGFSASWLVRTDEGDGCPVMYQALCIEEGYPVMTKPFGNCNEVSGVSTSPDSNSLLLTFDAEPQANRARTVVQLQEGCRLK